MLFSHTPVSQRVGIIETPLHGCKERDSWSVDVACVQSIQYAKPQGLCPIEGMWREHILGRYLCREISREEAVDAVGLPWVELAERQHAAMLEDLAWALEQ